MASLEEQIILEKLTGKCPIYLSGHEASQQSVETMGNYQHPQDTEAYLREIDRCWRTMENTRENRAFRKLYSCRAVIGALIVFCKRVIRKCLKWYIEPICDQQTEFNNAVTPAIRWLTQLQRLTSDMQQKQEEQLQELSEQVRQVGETTQQQQNELHSVQRQQEEQQEQLNLALQQLNEAREQLEELRNQGALTDIIANEQVIKKSTAQSGEDMISEYIVRLLGKRLEDVTYLDLGANHAKLYSNTYHFYQKGVRGVLVEANPALIGELKFYRSGDMILNRCIASTSGKTVDFYVLNGDGLSTPDLAGAETAIAENPYLKIEQVVPVKTITVEEILDTYFDCTPTIVNLDIEGNEMNILNSIDFKKHRPLVMIIETIPYRKHLVVGLKNQEIVDFMSEKNYIEYAFTGINSIFIDKEQIDEVLE